jgi:Protein of unknown function (DUF3826)
MIAKRNTSLLHWALPVLLIFTSHFSLAQPATDNKQSADEQYAQVLATRTEKILLPLTITDSSKYNAVKKLVMQQYRDVNAAHDKKKEGATDDQVTTALNDLHKVYITKLSALLSAQQVDQIKDGMTYGVLPVTYSGYQDMLPALTDDQKKQIMVWLIEAREHAMDEGSSEKKHQVFGKYKGRINNYLSAAGYDLKKEGEEWQKRIRERAAANKK